MLTGLQPGHFQITQWGLSWNNSWCHLLNVLYIPSKGLTCLISFDLRSKPCEVWPNHHFPSELRLPEFEWVAQRSPESQWQRWDLDLGVCHQHFFKSPKLSGSSNFSPQDTERQVSGWVGGVGGRRLGFPSATGLKPAMVSWAILMEPLPYSLLM